jgi:hypothetical protein
MVAVPSDGGYLETKETVHLVPYDCVGRILPLSFSTLLGFQQ